MNDIIRREINAELEKQGLPELGKVAEIRRYEEIFAAHQAVLMARISAGQRVRLGIFGALWKVVRPEHVIGNSFGKGRKAVPAHWSLRFKAAKGVKDALNKDNPVPCVRVDENGAQIGSCGVLQND